jgi:hypothetical protein
MHSGMAASLVPVEPAAAPAVSESTSARASLSVAVMTAGPGPRVAATLALVRPLAQEIIVALDDRAVADAFDDVAAVADRVIAYPFAEPVDRPLPWLFGECRCEWMLTLDDDEVPSAALLEALPALLADDRIVHYSLSRRWVYPTTSTYLDAPPWQPDYQLRLFRTDPRLIRFSDELHRPIIPRGPGRFVREPIWHLDTVLRDAGQRRAKADRYEVLRPGMRAAGRALNYGFYVPEARPDPPLSPVPEADRLQLDRLLAAERTHELPTARLERVTREAIDAHWPTPRDHQTGELQLVGAPAPFFSGEERALDVLVRNTGATTWQWGRASLSTVRCTSRWDDDEREDAVWTPLPSPVAPGESVVVPVHVRAPATPGRHRLLLDLVHEGVRWLGCDLVCAVEVRPRRRVAFIDTRAETVRDALAADPDVEPVLIGAGHGYPEARSPGPFLLGDSPSSLPALYGAFAGRALRLLLAARSGSRLPRGGRAFLDALATCDRAVVGTPPAGTRRERWVHLVAVAAARRLRIPMTPER